MAAPRRQHDPMPFGREQTRQFGAYARRGTGNQRHALSHDSMLLKSFVRYLTANACSRPQALGGMQGIRKHASIVKMREWPNYSIPSAGFVPPGNANRD